MNKILKYLLATMCITLTLVGCGKGKQEPNLAIEYNNEQMKVIHYGNFRSTDQKDIEERLKDYMIGKKFEELPAVAFDEAITLKNTNFDTDEFEIVDLVIDDKANIISEFDTTGTFVNKNEDGLFTFQFGDIVNKSKDETYKVDDNNRHCLLIKCAIDGSDFTFAILVLDQPNILEAIESISINRQDSNTIVIDKNIISKAVYKADVVLWKGFDMGTAKLANGDEVEVKVSNYGSFFSVSGIKGYYVLEEEYREQWDNLLGNS